MMPCHNRRTRPLPEVIGLSVAGRAQKEESHLPGGAGGESGGILICWGEGNWRRKLMQHALLAEDQGGRGKPLFGRLLLITLPVIG